MDGLEEYVKDLEAENKELKRKLGNNGDGSLDLF